MGASQGEITSHRIHSAINRTQRREGDTGSPEAQIGVLTVKIRALKDHIRRNHKDQGARDGLRALTSKRQKLMKYLKRRDAEAYYRVLMEMEIEDTVTMSKTGKFR